MKPLYEPPNPSGWDEHLVIAVDYDGTLTKRTDGSVDDVAISYVKDLYDLGCVIILWTSRYGQDLQKAIQECSKRGLQFDGINENPYRVSSQKVSADAYIDDKASPTHDIDWNAWIQHIRTKAYSNQYTLLER